MMLSFVWLEESNTPGVHIYTGWDLEESIIKHNHSLCL